MCVVFPTVRNLLTLSDGLIFFIKVKNRETVYKKLYVELQQPTKSDLGLEDLKFLAISLRLYAKIIYF